MKVLMTTDTLGEVWSYSLELCRHLKKYEVEVHLAAMGAWPSREQRDHIASCENVTLYKSDYKLEWMQDPWEDVEKSRKWLTCIYRTIQPDIVHLNNYTFQLEEWTCPIVTVFHSCMVTWWQAVKESSIPKSWFTYSEIVKTALNTSTMVVSPTKAILDKATKAHNIISKTTVIHNGREMDFSLPVPKEEFILCTIKILDEAKNLEFLSQLAQNLPWPVYMAGDHVKPNNGKKCEFANVHFLGHLKPKDLKSWMQRATVFLSFTKYEPFGMAILEAAKASCVLVLSNLDTLKEIWEENAVYFDPKDSLNAEKVLQQITSNKNLREELSTKSMLAATAYCSKKMALEYNYLYINLIQTKNKPHRQFNHSFQ